MSTLSERRTAALTALTANHGCFDSGWSFGPNHRRNDGDYLDCSVEWLVRNTDESMTTEEAVEYAEVAA